MRYLQRILNQPRLIERLTGSEVEMHEETHTHAWQIAAANLRDGIEKRRLANGEEKLVLCAGMRNFREPWARDFSFASFGLIELGELQATKEGLELFLMYQRPSGQFPVKIHSTNVVDRYLHSLFRREQPIVAPLRPKYITAHNTISLDGNGLLVIAALNYIRQTNDHDFADLHWGALKQAVSWMEEHATMHDHLLYQGTYTDWADSIARAGHVLYTNVLYWKALHDLAITAEQYERTADYEQLATKASLVQQAICEHFWNDGVGYFITSEQFKILNSDGNLLAVAWGLANVEQANHILDTMSQYDMADPVPTQVTNRPYPGQYIARENWLAGIGHYHTRAAWLWLGAWHVIALARMERLAEAEALLHRISQVIVRDGVVHEVYGLDGQPLSTLWYTSEAPLTWNAGMVVYAHHVYQRHYQEAA